jgi:hypothetical protein
MGDVIPLEKDQIPIKDQTSGVLQSILPVISMKAEKDDVDSTVNFKVVSNPTSRSASYPFDGSTEFGMSFNLLEAGKMSITVSKVDAVDSTLVNTKTANTIAVASHCRIWSKEKFSPSAVKIQTFTDDLVPSDLLPLDTTIGLRWNKAENGLQVANIALDPRNKARVRGYNFIFSATAESASNTGTDGFNVHIYRIALYNEIQYTGGTATDKPAGIPGVCPAMEFTGSTENKTLEHMNETMGETLTNTQCDTLFQTEFATYAAAELENNTSADFDSEVEARTDASMSGEANWGGVSGRASASASGRAKVKAAVTNELKTSMSASMGASLTSRARGCEAMTAMAQLMASAQKEATCVMNTLNNTMTSSGVLKQEIDVIVGNITDSSATVMNQGSTKMVVKFASSSEIDSTLTSIMSCMMDSITDVTNGISSEGLFAPQVGAKVYGVGGSASIAEASRTFANKVVTEQMASLRVDQSIRFRAGDILRSTVNVINDGSIDTVAGLMVTNVVKAVMDSEMLAAQKASWRSKNSAASKGATFDFMGMLLAPLIAVLVVGLFFLVGGPALLHRLATKYTMMFAVVVLVGSIVGMVISDSIGGYAASGIGIGLSLYLFFLVWKSYTTIHESVPNIVSPREPDRTED